MLCNKDVRLSYQPNEYMTVKDHVFKFEILLVLVLVDEGSFKLSFLADIELFNLNLLGINDAVL